MYSILVTDPSYMLSGPQIHISIFILIFKLIELLKSCSLTWACYMHQHVSIYILMSMLTELLSKVLQIWLLVFLYRFGFSFFSTDLASRFSLRIRLLVSLQIRLFSTWAVGGRNCYAISHSWQVLHWWAHGCQSPAESQRVWLLFLPRRASSWDVGGRDCDATSHSW